MRTEVALALAALGMIIAGAALGADDPVATRQQLMKANNNASKVAFAMVKGRTPFDAVAAAAAMNSIATDMVTFPTLFPPGSDQAPKTEASPDIFTHMDDFKALAAKLAADANTAADSAAIGLDAFTTAYNTVGQDCTACHNKYRTE
ncbi:MAG: cytochrome c [Bauldia sp.]